MKSKVVKYAFVCIIIIHTSFLHAEEKDERNTRSAIIIFHGTFIVEVLKRCGEWSVADSFENKLREQWEFSVLAGTMTFSDYIEVRTKYVEEAKAAAYATGFSPGSELCDSLHTVAERWVN